MKERTAPFMLMCLLVVLPLYSAGYLKPVDEGLSVFFDSVLAPLSPRTGSLHGPMPREVSMRRTVDRTVELLRQEGRVVDPEHLMSIGRIVERASLRFRLSPAFIFSVIHSESEFRADVVSPQGAVGLMQLQYATAAHVAAHAGIPAPTPSKLFDPETNILLGTGYLRNLIDRFGDVRTALAAYHLGPTEITRRVAEGVPFSDAYGRQIRVRGTFQEASVPVVHLAASRPPAEG